jgi:hypothetical protein
VPAYALPKTSGCIGERCTAKNQPCTTSYGGALSGTVPSTLLCMVNQGLSTCRVLVTFDRHLSSVFGKPCSIQDEESVGLRSP